MDVSFDHVVRQMYRPQIVPVRTRTTTRIIYRSWKKEKAKKEDNNINSKPFGTTRPFF